MFLDSVAMMAPRWGWSSIDDGIYKHFAPLELADEPIRLMRGVGIEQDFKYLCLVSLEVMIFAWVVPV